MKDKTIKLLNAIPRWLPFLPGALAVGFYQILRGNKK